MTSKEAADILNVSVRRVTALITAGHLKAERGRHNVWVLDSDDVLAFAALERAPGLQRSPRGKKRSK